VEHPAPVAQSDRTGGGERDRGLPSPGASSFRSVARSMASRSTFERRRGVGDRVFAPQENDAARQDEDEEEHEPDAVEDEAERGDDAAEAETLKEEQDPEENRDPAEPARQNAAFDHEQARCESKETA
jgi:hypothetical protein